MAVEVISSVLACATTAVALLSPCVREPITEVYNTYRTREAKLDELKGIMKDLEGRRSEVDRLYKAKVLSKSSEVFNWLENARGKVSALIQKKEEASLGKKDGLEQQNKEAQEDGLGQQKKENKEDGGSIYDAEVGESFCGLPNYRSRYDAAKKIENKIKELGKLLKDGKKFSNVEECNVVGQKKGTKQVSDAASARKVKEIIKYLTGKDVGAEKITGEDDGAEKITGEDDGPEKITGEHVGTILVHGMTGLGKTSIVSQVHDHILELHGKDTNGFQKVIWVTVEQKETTKSSTHNLQKNIAEKLQIDLKTENRAETLSTELNKLGKFLIILENMTNNLKLEEIGIPIPTRENGCKVIMVSRSRPVYYNMEFDKTVEIVALSDTEAEMLFETEAAMHLSELEDSAHNSAKQMIHECEGFPVAISLLAQTWKRIKNSGSGENNDALLDKLKDETSHSLRMDEKAYTRLKESYDMLTERAQQCFLYCALYPSGHAIEKEVLVKYWICEGLLDDMTKANEILDELFRAYLLQQETLPGVCTDAHNEQIKMLNLVRHMAVHLTKTGPPKFIIEAGKGHFEFLPKQEEFSEAERVSFMENQIMGLMEECKSEKLLTLLLQHNPITRLQNNFFLNMPNLKVLDLSHTNISSLSKSAFSNLKELRALLLRHCRNLISLPSLANCTKLLVLDLSDTPITELPDGMGELTKLICLNLSRTKVRKFQAGVVRALRDLKELLMITTDVSAACSLWRSENGESRTQELGALTHLKVLYINFPDAKSYNAYVGSASKSHCLTKFKICVGDCFDEPKFPEGGIVFSNTNFLVKGEPVSLLEETSERHVSENSDLRWLPSYNLNRLKVINIFGCDSLDYLFKSGMTYFLPNLERISVENCKKMEALIESVGDNGHLLDFQAPPHSPVLKFIRISNCENLVYLFRTKMVQFFPKIEDISISWQFQKNEEEKDTDAKKLEKSESLKELVLVDPVELNKTTSNGVQTGLLNGQTMWTFPLSPEKKMKIIISPQFKPRKYHIGPYHPKLMKSCSFGPTTEATPIPPDNKGVLEHGNSLPSSDINGKSKGKDDLFIK